MAGCIPWEADTGCCPEWADLDPGLQERALVLAWSSLRALTAGRVGSCPVTVRPCLSDPCDLCRAAWWEAAPWRPQIVAGEWVNVVCGTPKCSCSRLCEIVLDSEIARIEGATLDGIELAAELFRVDNGNRIVRIDGDCFPSCQHLESTLGEVGTLGITFVPGIEPDSSGLWAAGVLACEFSKACSGAKCRLPSGVTTVARPGLTFDVRPGLFPDGMVGIREVDAFIYSVNPHGLKTPARVWSPDVPWAGHRYTTSTPAP